MWTDIQHDKAPGISEVALDIYRYSRRWAVGQSTNPVDAVIYDACVTVVNDAHQPHRLIKTEDTTAASDRYLRYGAEPLLNDFTIPITIEDAVVILHRYARRYTNGRGSFTAAVVNAAAINLLTVGVSLDETQVIDGTIWAADGTGGEHDGLTPLQRDEALSVLPKTQPALDMSEQ